MATQDENLFDSNRVKQRKLTDLSAFQVVTVVGLFCPVIKKCSLKVDKFRNASCCCLCVYFFSITVILLLLLL